MVWLQTILAKFWEFAARLTSAQPGVGSSRCAAFVRYGGASGLGHVGWAFDYSPSEINAGSVENPTGSPTSAAEKMGYWNESCTDPIPLMRTKGYDALKYVYLTKADPESAYTVAKWVGTAGYKVIGRNCLDDVYDVLRAYGVKNLPLPLVALAPNEWFARFQAKLLPVADASWPKPQMQSMRERFKRFLAHLAPPKIPTWRRIGHPDWHALRQRIAEAHRH